MLPRFIATHVITTINTMITIMYCWPDVAVVDYYVVKNWASILKVTFDDILEEVGGFGRYQKVKKFFIIIIITIILIFIFAKILLIIVSSFSSSSKIFCCHLYHGYYQ